jgi:hypothetical protein
MDDHCASSEWMKGTPFVIQSGGLLPFKYTPKYSRTRAE